MQENLLMQNSWKQILQDLTNGVMVLGEMGKLCYANPAMVSFLEMDELDAASVAELMERNMRQENDAFFETILDAVYNKTQHNQSKVTYTTQSGRKYCFHMTASFFSGEEDCVIITLADETPLEAEIRKKHDATLGLIGAVMILCLCNLATGIYQYLDMPFPKEVVSRLSEILALGLFFIMLRYTDFSVRDIGIKSGNLLKELKETAMIGALLFGTLVVLKLLLLKIEMGPFHSAAPFFDWSRPGMFYLEYIFIAVFQEFLANCVLQENLNRVLTVKNGKLWALVIASFMFMALHLHLRLIYMLGAGVLKFVLGILYNRHRSILGLSFLHYEFGILAKILQWT